MASYLLVILGAEYIARLVPRGTHNWNKFVSPTDLQSWGTNAGLQFLNMQGFRYNVLTDKLVESSDASVNYILSFKKL